MAATAGFALLVVAYVPVQLIELVEQRPGPIEELWGRMVPQPKYLGVCVLALALGWPAGFFLNHFVDGDRERRKLVEERGDELEKVVADAVPRTYRDPQLHMITLTTKKVYIGLVLSETNPYGDRSFLTILKFGSGYRTEKRGVNIKTKYSGLITKVSKKESFENIPEYIEVEDFEVTIPKDKIIQISRFEPDLREHFPKGPILSSDSKRQRDSYFSRLKSLLS